MAQTKCKSSKNFDSFYARYIVKRIRRWLYELNNMLFKCLKPVNSSQGRILVIPSNNSRCKKRIFEKVMFCTDKEDIVNFLIVYGVLFTGMILKGI